MIDKLTKEINNAHFKMCTDMEQRCSTCKYGNSDIHCEVRFALDFLNNREMLVPSKINWEEIEVDTKVLVRNDKDTPWERRHFAEYKNGLIYVFKNGTTSFSASGSWSNKYSKSAYSIAKLYKEENENG